MSTYVLSDIHGCSVQYHEMLKKIEFSVNDVLYIIGDVIDRGPKGAELFWEIMHTENVRLIMGNHEFMMLDAIMNSNYSTWTLKHGEPTIAGLDQFGQEKLIELLQYVMTLPYNVEINVAGQLYELVHACPMSICGQDKYEMIWNRVDVTDVHDEDRVVIFGHTPTIMIAANSFQPFILHGEHAMNIDCGCVYGGQLGCIRLDDMKEFYVVGPYEV